VETAWLLAKIMRLSASVRVKVFLVSALVLTALVGVATAVLLTVIRPSFRDLEHAHASDHANLIKGIITQDIKALDILVRDWSSWDDTYTYALDRNEDYETSNLVPETFTGAGINLLLIQDQSGRQIWTRGYDLEEGHFISLPAFESGADLIDRLTRLTQIKRSGLQGLVQTGRGTMVISARPILTSQEEGPSRGVLMMGRLLTTTRLAHFEDIIGQPLTAWSATSPDLPAAARVAVAPRTRSPVLVTQETADTTAVYVVLNDVFGDPTIVIGSHLERTIAAAGQAVVTSAALMIAVAGSVLIAVFLWSQQRLVLGPLKQLTQHIQTVTETSELTHTLDLSRRDELGTVANAFNQMQARIAQLAYFDTVTGLPNRRLFEDRADQILRIAHRSGLGASILFLDLDGFKAINDSHGHSTGDALLRAVALDLHDIVRDSDTIARFGGDEFVIVLHDLHEPGLELELANRILARFAQPFQVGSEALFTGASIGIARFPKDGDTVEALIAKADSAMYHAKREGGHRVMACDPSYQRDTEHMLNVDQTFRESLISDQLFLVFQPLVDLATGAVVGHEALVRWKHPERGVLTAESFIHLVDRGGLFATLDAWVLRAACAALSQSLASQDANSHTRIGATLERINVNICARHVETDGLLGIVSGILHETGVAADRLTLEISESIMISRPDAAARVLKGLRELGVRIAIDDFGTGYASLSALHHLPTDIIKIDRSFIAGVPHDPVAVAITHSTLMLAQTLGLSVIAEGIETVEQRDFLKAAGCPVGQGYLLGG